MCEESTKELHGQQIFCRHWKAATDDPKCLVFICHGFGEHSGRYNELVAVFNKENMYVFSHDHVGHGKSSGARVWVNSYESFYIPVKQHIDETAAKFPGKKVFIFGHSMGGLISTRLMQLHSDIANGLVLESPFLGIPESVPKWQVNVGTFLGRCIGSLPVSKLDTGLLTRTVDVVRDYDNDPLVFHGKSNARFIAASTDAINDVFKNTTSSTTPILICHGDADRICPISGSKSLFEQAASSDKTFKEYVGGYHQLHTDLEEVQTPFVQAVVQWINTRC